jgi:DNA-binding transcriptional ArsR family regulator
MTDIFKAIADPKARLVLETLADKPGSTVAKTAEFSKLTSAQVTTIVASLVEAKLVKSTGSGASKKYTLNAKGFGPYVSWLAKVAETSAVSNLELQLVDLGEKLGGVVAEGSDWVSTKLKENVDIDPKKWGKELGRIMAEVKREVQKETTQVKKEATKIVTGVKKEVKKATTGVKKEVKKATSGVKKEVKKATTGVKKEAKAIATKAKGGAKR